ncbi:MAG: TetR/AcrR family transcriptional regulator [Prolixibacteraceae bacterium]|jgi:AcrR family transcriptional regulator|nr:TetR/AcrR family transcriptional regulator [Prolixibacteraceae bacterium]
MTEKIEQIIIAKSKEIFISQGFAGARMQAIADAAGINKALLHYYYRSKEKLYVHVVQEIIEEIVKNIITIIESESDVESKIKNIVEMYSMMIKEYPKLPLFFLNEIHEDPDRLIRAINKYKDRIINIQNQLDLTDLEHLDTSAHFLVNVISMSVFPFLAKPLLNRLFFDQSDYQFDRFIEDRPRVISDVLKNSLK